MKDVFSQRIEYHRNAVALLPPAEGEDSGVAIWIGSEKEGDGAISCNCGTYKKNRTCRHVKEMWHLVGQWADAPFVDAAFRQSVWHRLAAALHESSRVDPKQVVVSGGIPHDPSNRSAIHMGTADGGWQLVYLSDHRGDGSAITETELLMQRCGLQPDTDQPLHRGRIRSMLARMTMTESESMMAQKGHQTRRQALEAGFWYQFAYHCFRISGENGVLFKAAADKKEGAIVLHCHFDGHPLFELTLPRDQAYRLINRLGGELTNPEEFQMYPEALESIAKVAADTAHNLIVTLCFRLTLPDGSTEWIERKRLKKYWYQDAVYFPDKGFFATVKQPDRLWEKFGGKYSKKIKKDRVPKVLDQIGANLFGPPNIVDESVRQMRVHRACEVIEVSPAAIDQDWYWLSVAYGFGENVSVSLAELYQAKKSGRRFIPVADGWVDVKAVELDMWRRQPDNRVLAQLESRTAQLKLSRLDLFRLRAAADAEIAVSGEETDERRQLEQLLTLTSSTAYQKPFGMATTLRHYQQRGVEWLVFLYENRFGGLLCDDMGLGKTHQVMALMAWLLEHKEGAGPFLVVCPTSVISHWERKIQEHAPGLAPLVYHGADRELEALDPPGRVLITSYGILFRDIGALSGFQFTLVAFDEAQSLKNPKTKSYIAAQSLRAEMKLGVTGTPIENRLSELKALMDLCLPGYLGSDDAFESRYGDLSSRGRMKRRKIELNRLIAPFTLRRLKASVLTELPDKIEDIRYCRLTDTQVRLYREAVADRGRGLRYTLEKADTEIPYIHIFALLTLLKQICDHPAIIDPERYETAGMPLDSGKWELFTDLLAACIENNQKVVVYSQFIAMIQMIEAHLKAQGIGAAILTGATRNRGEVIDRFNQSPDCRVFVGSLKAGGTGIDLTAGSVVIHYDRWWNAAKEDQATDRVHRIGQKRGVQVFKLVTAGTLEEKISAIIAHKKNLMADIVKEDDPGLLKTFSRSELIDLLTAPDEAAGRQFEKI